MRRLLHRSVELLGGRLLSAAGESQIQPELDGTKGHNYYEYLGVDMIAPSQDWSPESRSQGLHPGVNHITASHKPKGKSSWDRLASANCLAPHFLFRGLYL